MIYQTKAAVKKGERSVPSPCPSVVYGWSSRKEGVCVRCCSCSSETGDIVDVVLE